MVLSVITILAPLDEQDLSLMERCWNFPRVSLSTGRGGVLWCSLVRCSLRTTQNRSRSPCASRTRPPRCGGPNKLPGLSVARVPSRRQYEFAVVVETAAWGGRRLDPIDQGASPRTACRVEASSPRRGPRSGKEVETVDATPCLRLNHHPRGRLVARAGRADDERPPRGAGTGYLTAQMSRVSMTGGVA